MTTALETIREDQALGAAWRRAEAALPEGAWQISLMDWSRTPIAFNGAFEALVLPFGYKSTASYHARGSGPTPTAALLQLADKLEALR